eukprot:12059884-Heterocapsa_arctica.AAC.1
MSRPTNLTPALAWHLLLPLSPVTMILTSPPGRPSKMSLSGKLNTVRPRLLLLLCLARMNSFLPCRAHRFAEARLRKATLPLALRALSASLRLRVLPVLKAALDSELERLRDKSVWDESTVREWSAVAYEAQQDGNEVNFGYMFALCVEKNYELPADHPNQKCKGR